MKTIACLLVFFLFAIHDDADALKNRRRLLMDYHWKFIQADIKDAEKYDFNDSDMADTQPSP